MKIPLQGPVCYECGISANVLTCLKKYGNRPLQLAFTVSTYHVGECACCGEEKDVTEQRDFFYPDFSLLERAKPGMSFKKLK
jgi:hypothetical protein